MTHYMRVTWGEVKCHSSRTTWKSIWSVFKWICGHVKITSFECFFCNYLQRIPRTEKTKSKKSVAKSLSTDFHYITAEKLKNRKQPQNIIGSGNSFFYYWYRKQPISCRFWLRILSILQPNRWVKKKPKKPKSFFSVLAFRWHPISRC